MNSFFRYFLSVIFIFFAFLQYNDPDGYIWTFLYFSVAIIIFYKKPIGYVRYLHFFLLSICSILFINNIDILITSQQIQHEVFYELGGIMLILITSYFKLIDWK